MVAAAWLEAEAAWSIARPGKPQWLVQLKGVQAAAAMPAVTRWVA